MRQMRVALVCLALLGSGGAQAHAHLNESSPADGSVLAAAPAALTLSFSEPAQLTALSIELAGGASAKLSVPAQAQARISVTLPKLAAGAYLVRWRVLGSDGHVVPGQIRFTVTQ
jgi:methionine-rich copper-binding protein CopC